jgi:hypothetical protein
MLLTQQLVAAQARGEWPREQVDFVEAAASLRFTTKRRRDEGNFRATLEKALGDALVGDRAAWPEGRWIPDDTRDHFRFGDIDFHVDEREPALTVIAIGWSKARLL